MPTRLASHRLDDPITLTSEDNTSPEWSAIVRRIEVHQASGTETVSRGIVGRDDQVEKYERHLVYNDSIRSRGVTSTINVTHYIKTYVEKGLYIELAQLRVSRLGEPGMITAGSQTRSYIHGTTVVDAP